jgi:hypothetical protein
MDTILHLHHHRWIAIQTSCAVRIDDASFGNPAITALIHENGWIPHTVAAVASICFSLSPSCLHQIANVRGRNRLIFIPQTEILSESSSCIIDFATGLLRLCESRHKSGVVIPNNPSSLRRILLREIMNAGARFTHR